MPSHAIASCPPPGQIITDLAELRALFNRWRADGCQILAPADSVTHLATRHGAIVTPVLISQNPRDREIYESPSLPEGEYGLTRIGMQRLEGAAGVSWLPQSERKDDRTIQHLWEYQSFLTVRDFSGEWRTVKGTAEVDLRDESAQIGGFSEADWRALVIEDRAAMAAGDWTVSLRKLQGGWNPESLMLARKHGLRECETKSQTAAMRAAFAMKGSYSMLELCAPFMVVRVVFIPNLADPIEAAEVRERAQRGSALLFPARREKTETLPMMTAYIADPSNPPWVRQVRMVAKSDPFDTPGLPQAQDPSPAPANGYSAFVVDFLEIPFTRPNGEEYLKAKVLLSDDRQLVTVKPRFRDALRTAWCEQWPPLAIADTTNQFGEQEIVSIEDASGEIPGMKV